MVSQGAAQRGRTGRNGRSALIVLTVLTVGFALSATPVLPAVPAEADGEPAAAPVVVIDRAALPVAVENAEGVQSRLFRDGRVFIAGQPSEEALARFKEGGVTAVVNLRTQRELDNREWVPYDERAAVEKLGLEYVHLPIGGDEQPWRPEVIDALADVLERHRGPVLLHCTVGWRASYVWTAYLIRELGLPLEEAWARGEAIALNPDPLGQLLGRPVHLTLGAPPEQMEVSGND